MQMRCRISMNFVVHLDRLHDRHHGRRHPLHVPHERCPLGLGQIMQLDCVASEDQTRVAADRVVGPD